MQDPIFTEQNRKTCVAFQTKNLSCWNGVLRTDESQGFKEISGLWKEPLSAAVG